MYKIEAYTCYTDGKDILSTERLRTFVQGERNAISQNHRMFKDSGRERVKQSTAITEHQVESIRRYSQSPLDQGREYDFEPWLEVSTSSCCGIHWQKQE